MKIKKDLYKRIVPVLLSALLLLNGIPVSAAAYEGAYPAAEVLTEADDLDENGAPEDPGVLENEAAGGEEGTPDGDENAPDGSEAVPDGNEDVPDGNGSVPGGDESASDGSETFDSVETPDEEIPVEEGGFLEETDLSEAYALAEDDKLTKEDGLLEEDFADLTEALNGAASGKITTGVYAIASSADPSFVLTAKDDSVAYKANIELGLDTGRQSQLFYVADLGNGRYRIENLNSGCVLDCAGGGTEKGTNIQQYRVNSTVAQTFTITENSSGLYTIGAGHCPLVLDVEAGSAADGTNVRLWRSNGTAAQQWIFTKAADPLASGLYYISNSQSGKVIEPAGGSYARKANIGVEDKSGAPSQRYLVRTKDGGATYSIIDLYSRLTLDVESGSKASGANIQQYRINGTEAQAFRIVPLISGGYRISSMLGSLPLTAEGSNVCQKTLSVSDDKAQSWTFEKAPADPVEGMYRILSAKNPAMGLDIYGGDWNIRTNVQLYTETTSNSQVNQQFTLASEGDGWFTITNVGSGKVLDKAGGAENMSEENVQQYKPNGTIAQRWRFVDTGDLDGSYYIVNGVGTYLDIKGGTMANGTNIQAHRGNKTAAQKWYLEPTAFSGNGWRTVNTYERSYYKNGVKLTGWQKIGNDYYYFKLANGVMAYSREYQGWELDSCGRRHAITAATILSSVKPGGKTLKNLIQNALIPCGRVLYIWGGGWGDSDSSRIGYLPSWGTFFKEHATATYNRNNYRYSYGSGLDCSGYMVWVLYNTQYTQDHQFSIGYQGSVAYTSTKLAQRAASLGWATYKAGAVGAYTDLRPGDIVSMDGHIWMYLGSCSDGSGVIVHSSPMGQTYGGGVQLAGTTDRNGNRNSEGYRLAKAYMEKYFTEWPYATNVCSVSYRSTAVGYARWKNDPDGFKNMSAQQVLSAILGSV